MDLVIGISFLAVLIVMAMVLGMNRPKSTRGPSIADAGPLALIGLTLAVYSYIVYF